MYSTQVSSPRADRKKSTISTLLAALLVCSLIPLLSPSASAAPPSRVHSVNSSTALTVSVPADGPAAFYYAGSKKITIPAGSEAPLPAGALRIFLPKGSIINTSNPCAHCDKGIKNAYTVKESMTLAALTPAAFNANKTNFEISQPLHLGDHCICRPEGNIKLPSKSIAALIRAIASANSNGVNPFNVLGGDVTDGNQP